MGMLTGLISPSSGMALIDNKDISVEMPEIRKSLGVCPQVSLTSQLTPIAHARTVSTLTETAPPEACC
jgi:ABC-type multidrug transport system ATPase subunit